MEPPKYDGGGVRATSKTVIFVMQNCCYCHRNILDSWISNIENDRFIRDIRFTKLVNTRIIFIQFRVRDEGKYSHTKILQNDDIVKCIIKKQELFTYLFIYLIIYFDYICLNDALSSSDYIAWNGRLISECWVGRYVTRSSHELIWGSTLIFAWTVWQKTRKTSGLLVSPPIFEPDTFWIHGKSTAAWVNLLEEVRLETRQWEILIHYKQLRRG
jgi:hypothetical protein